MILKFLGTADSSGIPSHNCTCQICQEYREKKKVNLATSAYIKCNNGEIILLDAGIENIATLFDNQKINSVLLTHFHPDHALGLLRLRYSSDNINCYHPKDSIGFADLFKYPKSIQYKENIPFQAITINELTFTPIPLRHSKNTTGYIIQGDNKTIAYLTDCSGISDISMNYLLKLNIDECYIDAGLDPKKSKGNHLNYNEATVILDKIAAKKSYFIHGSHLTFDYIRKNNIQLKYKYMEL